MTLQNPETARSTIPEGFEVGPRMDRKVLRLEQIFNVVGGITTLVSVALPWGAINGGYNLSIFSTGAIFLIPVTPFLLAGGVVSLLSRYGGFLTLIGEIAFLLDTYYYFTPSNGQLFTFSWGFWLGWVGAALSLLGENINTRFVPRRATNAGVRN